MNCRFSCQGLYVSAKTIRASCYRKASADDIEDLVVVSTMDLAKLQVLAAKTLAVVAIIVMSSQPSACIFH